MNYKKLFELSIFHEYYRDNICPDFVVEPTIKCSKILRGHHLIVKNKVNGIVVVAPVDSGNKPEFELADNLQLTFKLKLKNKNFLDFTEIDWEPVDNYIYQCSNQNTTQIGESDLEITETQLSIQKLPKGKNIFGIVDIYNNSSLPKNLSQSSEYKITFQAKKQQWCYYLITDNITNGNEFLILDKDTTRKAEIKFTRFAKAEADKTDPIFSALSQQFPQSQQYLFKSDLQIPCQEGGIKNIQLVHQKNGNGQSENVWIDHLPNPPNHKGIQVINALKYL